MRQAYACTPVISGGIALVEKQVLFRIDAKLLESLDKKIVKDGFTTRNAWFKDVVSQYAARSRGASAGGAAKARKARR